jgi:hypothetical protein
MTRFDPFAQREIHDFIPATPRRDAWRIVVIIMLVIGLAAIVFGALHAKAAELTRLQRVTGWFVNLCRDNPDDWADGLGCRRLSGHVATRGDCEAIKAAVIVKVRGPVRLRCDYIDELQVRQ